MKKTLADLAAAYNTTVRTLSRAKREGCDVQSAAAFRRWQSNQQSTGKAPSPRAVAAAMAADDDAGPASASYDELRCRRTLAQSQLLEHDLAVKRGQFVSVAEMKEDIQRAVATFQAGLRRLEGELPSMIEGMPPARMAKEIGTYCDEMIVRLRDELRADPQSQAPPS